MVVINNKVAVIGISCIAPLANHYKELWDNLLCKKECLSQGLNSSEESKESRIGTYGLIENVDAISNLVIDERYIPYVDPQLKLLAALVDQAIADRDMGPCNDERTGVFCSSNSSYEWRRRILLPKDLQTPAHLKKISYVTDHQYYSSLISYSYGYTGQSLMIAASCTSSLAAVHMAITSLLRGDVECAIAGGVSVQPDLWQGYYYDSELMYSKSGKCRVFDQEADGAVPSDGGGIVILKRLEDAIKDGDKIYAVISASSMNNDGRRKMGYVVPSILGIAESVKCAMNMAGVAAKDFSFLELHGSGTHFGDCIEFEAFKEAFGAERGNYCAIGSMKPNIGYMESASGVVGLIKAILSSANRLFPGTINFNTVNRDMDIIHSPFYINTDTVPLNGEKVIGGVNNYGDGGNNIFMIVESR